MISKAVILAGGKGTRLGRISKDTPKALQKIGSRPILYHHLLLLEKYGINEVYVITNFLHIKIENYIKKIKKEINAHIYVYKESKELGTVGGIKELENQLNNLFFVLYGDIMINLDLNKIAKFHFKKNSEVTLAIHPTDHPKDSDLLEINESQRIINFYSKRKRNPNLFYQNLSNAGLYIFSPKIFSFLEFGVKADFGRDVFPDLVKKLNIYGYNTPEYLKDIGTPYRISKVRADFKNKVIQKKNLELKQKAIFIDRDGVVNKLNGYISNPNQLEIYEDVIEAIKLINNSSFLAIIITNQPVVARGECSIEGLKNIHNKLETILGNFGVKIDCIYFCPHHPDKGFKGENKLLKINCDCRKPRTKMVDLAIERFNIDKKESYIIGDTWRDIECAKNANIKMILIDRYSKENSTNDIIFKANNLLDAVKYILK